MSQAMGLCYVPLRSWVTASYSMTLTTLPQCWSTCNLSIFNHMEWLNLVDMHLILMNLIVSKTVVNETHEVDNPFCGFFLVLQTSAVWLLACWGFHPWWCMRWAGIVRMCGRHFLPSSRDLGLQQGARDGRSANFTKMFLGWWCKDRQGLSKFFWLPGFWSRRLQQNLNAETCWTDRVHSMEATWFTRFVDMSRSLKPIDGWNTKPNGI